MSSIYPNADHINAALLAVRQSCLNDRVPSIAILSAPDVDQIRIFADMFRAPIGNWQLLDNVWTIAGLKTDETRNARVLAWYLDPQGGHGLGSGVLERFLAHLNLPYGGATRIMLEKYPDGLGASRVDIMLDDPAFLVIIEVKIWAGEQPAQLARYSELAARRVGSARDWKLVYLTRTGKASRTIPNGEENVTSMPWGMMACFLREASKDVSDIAGFLANGFVEHIKAKEGLNAHE
jgi:hypothetical protein